MDTQTQIDRLIELAIVQRSDLKKLISELPQLREHLSAEIERIFEDSEPQIRAELEDWTTKQAKDETAKLGSQLEAKLISLSKSLEATTQARYNAIMAERAQNIDLAKKAEDKLAEVAQAIPVQVKQIVTDELSRFPRAGEIDQLRKEFAEPRGLNPRGRWEPGATYYKLDLVAYNGDSYVANEETSEKPNRNSSKWTLNAARGQAGGGGFITPAQGDYTASMITNVPAGVITSTNVQDAINELAADVDVSQNTLDALVTNAESVAITKGQVVYAFGATGNRMSVKRALNTGDATSAKTIGVVLDSSIAAGATGNIRCVGVVDGLTLGSYTEGDTVYLGATAGSITATKPYAPNHLVYVGIVERANNGNGELYVKIQNGYELDEIHDVQITSAPLAGALLMRDATNSLWKANRLTGTTNQVTVTNADTAVTLSLPTSLASVDSVTASASTALTLTGGSSGASLVLGQGASAGSATITGTGTGLVVLKPSATGLAGILSGAGTTNGVKTRLFLGGLGFSGFENLAPTISAVQEGVINYSGLAFDVFNVNRYEAARLTSTGNLLIGTTTDMTGSGGLKIAGTTAATTTTSGALIVAGGVGVSGAGYFGGNVTLVGGSAAVLSNPAGGLLQTAGVAGINNVGFAAVTNRASLSYGAYIKLDSTSVSSGRKWAISSSADLDTGTTVGALDFFDETTAVSPFNLSGGALASGKVSIRYTTPANSSISGALTIGNGSAATNVAVGAGKVNIGSTEASTGSTSGALQVAGGIYAGAASVFGSSANVGTRLVINNSGTTNANGIDFGNGAYIFRNQSGGIRITTTNQLYVEGDVVPTPTGSYDLGSSSLKWRNSFFVGTVTAGAVVSSAASDLAIGTGTFGTALTFGSVTGAATFAGAVTANGQLIGKGTATNDNAATGYIGEYVEAAVAYGAAVAITTNTAANVTSISLTAGDWDIAGTVYYAQASGTTSTLITGSVSSSSGVIGAEDGGRVNHTGAVGNASEWTCATGPCRVSLSGTTTYYLVAYSSFTGSNSSAFGKIRARRVR